MKSTKLTSQTIAPTTEYIFWDASRFKEELHSAVFNIKNSCLLSGDAGRVMLYAKLRASQRKANTITMTDIAFGFCRAWSSGLLSSKR